MKTRIRSLCTVSWGRSRSGAASRMRSRTVRSIFQVPGYGDMEERTVQLYERQARVYAEHRPARHWAQVDAFAPRCLPGLPVLDAGCGPGGYLRSLPRPAVALDAAMAMLQLTRAAAPAALLVQAD